MVTLAPGSLSITLRLLPKGWRFQPTDEELVNHYLKGKITGRIKNEEQVIPEVDVCSCEPWDLPDKSIIISDDQEWFFFAPKDRKYANGHRTNRATEAGYWKATGKDRYIRSKAASAPDNVIGKKKTLVFHQGRAPKGTRTNWIMHEYRTTEREFEGGYVLYRLFKRTEERGSNSQADEMESSGFSPTPTKSSPDGRLPEADGMEGISTPLNQTSPESVLLEEPESLLHSVEQQQTGIQRCLADKADRSATFSVKPDGVSCNIASDNHDATAGVHDVSTQCHGPHCQQIDSSGFLNSSSQVLPYTDHVHVDQADLDGFHNFLDDILNNPDEYSARASDVRINLAAETVRGHGISDSASFRDSETSSNIDTEAGLPQEPVCLEASDDCYEEPPCPLNVPSQLNTSYGCPEIKLQRRGLYENASLLRYSCTGRDVYSVDSPTESLQELWNSPEDSSNQKNIADNGDGLEVTGIKFRVRKLQDPSDSKNMSAQQGAARRRFRLQVSVQNASFACGSELSSSGDDHEDKETMKKALQDLFDGNEESWTQKDTPSKEDGFEGTGIMIRTQKAQYPPSSNELPSNLGIVGRRICLCSLGAGSFSCIAGESSSSNDDQAGEHVDDNIDEFREISEPALWNKLERFSVHDDAANSSGLYEESIPMLRLRRKGTYDNANAPKEPPSRLKISSTGSIVACAIWLVLSVILLRMCFGIWRCINSQLEQISLKVTV